jgi:choline-phosphate cytidylyltransferase
VKSEGELIVSGTEGYLYVPAPWWKTDYFEIRYEDRSKNKRYFYQLDGEGIRYELVAFARAAEKGRDIAANIDHEVTECIAGVMEDIQSGRAVRYI